MQRHIILALSLALISPAIAAAPDAPDLLRGPEVDEHQTRSLVGKDMMGRFEPLDVRPEAAALLELGLDESTGERARAIVERRALDIAMLLVDKIDTVAEMTDMIAEGDRVAAREKMREMWNEFEPGSPRAPLLEPLRGVLGPERFVEMKQLVDEYWEAWIDWEMRKNDRRRENPEARRRVEGRLSFRLFEREVRRGYEASLSRYRRAIEGVYNAVNPTDEQRQAIRSIIIEHIKATRLDATPEQRRATNLRIYRLLDDGRKEKFFEYMTRAVIPDD